MFDVHSYSRQLESCRHVLVWSRDARSVIDELLCDADCRRRFGARLGWWQRALASLESETEWCLRAARAGLYLPAAVANLLVKARQAMRDFAPIASEQKIKWRGADRVDPERAVPIGEHTLPPLPYAYDALEPYIDEQTMRLHHDKHHQSYVDGLNKAERMMAQARETDDFDLLKHWEREAAFNGAGHYLHTIFWNIMNPDGGGEPSGPLAEQIAKDFGSYAAFKNQFSAAAAQVEAVGWALLVWSPRSHRLAILQAEKHQNLSQWDVIPLLVLDVWEHAYYLKYQNQRREYIDAWWNVVDWEHVAGRFEQARKLQWEPY